MLIVSLVIAVAFAAAMYVFAEFFPELVSSNYTEAEARDCQL